MDTTTDELTPAAGPSTDRDPEPNSPVVIARRSVLGAAVASGAALAVAPTHVAAAPVPADEQEDVLRVSSLGHDLLDSTEFLQAALDSEHSTIIIDHVPGGWSTRPLFLRRSNVTIIIEPDVMVRAINGTFTGANDCLLTLTDVTDVTISGYGAKFAMAKPEYQTGEWRMALKILGSRNVLVEGLMLRDSGGDGVYLGRGATLCRDITLRDLVVDNHRRQGMSVITVEGLEIEGCAFLNTNGTAPQSGIDFEPNAPDDKLTDIVLRDCWFAGNMTSGVMLAGLPLTPTSTPVSIVIERSTVSQQVGGSPQVMVLSSPSQQFPGTFEIRDSLIHVNEGSSAFRTFRTGPGGVLSKLTRTGMWVWGCAFQVYPPVQVAAGTTTTEYGNIHFTDVVMHTDQPGPFLATDHRENTTVHDITGAITVVGPAVEKPDLGPDPQGVDLDATIVDSVPAATVSVRPGRSSVIGGKPAEVIFTRTGDRSRPLAIAYETSGGARERYDYGGLGKVAVFAPGAREVRVAIRTFARRREVDLERRELVVSVAVGHGYVPHHGSATIQIQG